MLLQVRVGQGPGWDRRGHRQADPHRHPIAFLRCARGLHRHYWLRSVQQTWGLEQRRCLGLTPVRNIPMALVHPACLAGLPRRKKGRSFWVILVGVGGGAGAGISGKAWGLWVGHHAPDLQGATESPKGRAYLRCYGTDFELR